MIQSLKLTPAEVDFLRSKKIGLVLSGGASRGFAEVGVMSVFEKHSIRPTCIVGCSVGSLVGACVAGGKSVSLLRTEFVESKPFTWRDLTLFKHSGLLNSDHVVGRILKVLNLNSFSDLQIPLIINATNLNTGKERVFMKGKLLPALCASIAFPGVIAPKKIGRHYYADGGITTPIPIHLLPHTVDLVIIVDVTGKLRPLADSSSTLTLLRNTYEIMLHHLSNKDIQKTMSERDLILIQPPVDSFGLFNFNIKNTQKMMKTGEVSARKALKLGIRRLKAKQRKMEAKPADNVPLPLQLP